MPTPETVSEVQVFYNATTDSKLFISALVKVPRASRCALVSPPAERWHSRCQRSMHIGGIWQAWCRDHSPFSNSSRVPAAKGFTLSSSASCHTTPPGTHGLIYFCFLLQGTTSSGFLTVLSNSSDFLPYAVVASALLAL